MPLLSPRHRSSSASASRRRRQSSAERAEAAHRPAAAPLSARATGFPGLGEFPQIQQAVVALPLDAPLVVAEGNVVEDPTKAALRFIRESFAPFVIVRAQSSIFVVHVRIGEGLCSAVFQVEDRIQGKPFALKVVPLCEPFSNAILGTATLLRRLKHKHIIHCYEHFRYVSQGMPFLILKLLPCLRGSLGDVLRRSSRGVNSTLALTYITQLASALEYLHHQGILHGDLRPDHVLLCTHDEEVKLTGLTHSIGLRRRALGPVTVTGGQRLYAPPEWAESSFLGRALFPTEVPLPSYDMWALGCLLADLVTGKLLEERLGRDGTPLALDTSALEAVQRQMQSMHSGAFAQLSEGLLDNDPETRLDWESAQQLLRTTARKVNFWSDIKAKLKLSRRT